VTIHDACNLPVGDTHGVSDPYVVCQIFGRASPEFQTKVIEQSLDPVWNEEYAIRSYTPGEALHFLIMDEDNPVKESVTSNDFLGEVLLGSEEFYPRATESLIVCCWLLSPC
ncbi:unnamed protein product, partial [Polarella glacialis]